MLILWNIDKTLMKILRNEWQNSDRILLINNHIFYCYPNAFYSKIFLKATILILAIIYVDVIFSYVNIALNNLLKKNCVVFGALFFIFINSLT